LSLPAFSGHFGKGSVTFMAQRSGSGHARMTSKFGEPPGLCRRDKSAGSSELLLDGR